MKDDESVSSLDTWQMPFTYLNDYNTIDTYDQQDRYSRENANRIKS